MRPDARQLAHSAAGGQEQTRWYAGESAPGDAPVPGGGSTPTAPHTARLPVPRPSGCTTDRGRVPDPHRQAPGRTAPRCRYNRAHVRGGEGTLRQSGEEEFVHDPCTRDANRTLLVPSGMRCHHHAAQHALGSHGHLWAVVETAHHLTCLHAVEPDRGAGAGAPGRAGDRGRCTLSLVSRKRNQPGRRGPFRSPIGHRAGAGSAPVGSDAR
jgi:hypothetical protein